MIAVDSNILVYSHREDSPWHAAALECVTGLAEGRAQWGIPWPCLHEFLSVVTHPRIYAPPTPLDAAVEQVDAWLESPSLVLLAEDEAHWPQLRALVDELTVLYERIRFGDQPLTPDDERRASALLSQLATALR
jgi:predicted nucleic acid-binding protein